MSDDKPLISRRSSDLARKPLATHPVLQRMAEHVLVSRARELEAARVRIGCHVLRAADARQIDLWATAVGTGSSTLLKILEESRLESVNAQRIAEFDDLLSPIQFCIEDGAIISLVWDFDQLPDFPDLWVEGVRLRELGFTANYRRRSAFVLAPKAPELSRLVVAHRSGERIALAGLDLRGVPNLERLECSFCLLLTELDLSPVTRLKALCCEFSSLTELDLSPTPELTVLNCKQNKLTELDLSPAPKLTTLVCGGNRLTALDLSRVPALRELLCYSNQLTELNLSPVPRLTTLNCEFNPLTALDLSPVTGLTELRCNSNRLTKLDLLPVPKLTELDCSDNQLTALTLSSTPMLVTLFCEGNHITELDLAPVQSLTRVRCDTQAMLRSAPEGAKVWPRRA